MHCLDSGVEDEARGAAAHLAVKGSSAPSSENSFSSLLRISVLQFFPKVGSRHEKMSNILSAYSV